MKIVSVVLVSLIASLIVCSPALASIDLHKDQLPIQYSNPRLRLLAQVEEHDIMTRCVQVVQSDMDARFPAGIFDRFRFTDAEGNDHLVTRSAFMVIREQDCFVQNMRLFLTQPDISWIYLDSFD